MEPDVQTVAKTAETTLRLYELAGPVLIGFLVFATILFIYEVARRYMDSRGRTAFETLIEQVVEGQKTLVLSINDKFEEMRTDKKETETRFLDELRTNRRQLERILDRSQHRDIQTLEVLQGFKQAITLQNDGISQLRGRMENVERALNLDVPKLPFQSTVDVGLKPPEST